MKFLVLVVSVLLAESVRVQDLGLALALVLVLGTLLADQWGQWLETLRAEELEWALEYPLVQERARLRARALVSAQLARVRAQESVEGLVRESVLVKARQLAQGSE